MLYFGAKLSDNITETPEGFLICHDVIIARTGMQEYSPSEVPVEAKDGTTVKINRDKKEVLRAETIASFEGKPVTVGHPQDFVTPENWNDLAVGVAKNVRAVEDGDDGYIVADLVITNIRAIEAVKDGLREVSCGYEADYIDKGDGTGKQTNILGNHVALVLKGRCGSICAIKDGAINQQGEEMTMKEKLLAAIAKVFDGKDEEEVEQKDAPEVIKKDEEMPQSSGAIVELSAKIDKLLEAIGKLISLEQKEQEEEMVNEEKAKDKCDEEVTADADTISRAEIIAPGIAKTGDVKAKALDAFKATEEGAEILKTFDGLSVDAQFLAVSELLKVQRSGTLTRPTADTAGSKALTADDINKLNSEYWAKQRR